jgi:hypothetical protein
MRILADTNVPVEYVAALRGDGHDVRYSRAVEPTRPTAHRPPDGTPPESSGSAAAALSSS